MLDEMSVYSVLSTEPHVSIVKGRQLFARAVAEIGYSSSHVDQLRLTVSSEDPYLAGFLEGYLLADHLAATSTALKSSITLRYGNPALGQVRCHPLPCC